MERTYEDIKLGIASNKRFTEAKTGVVDASRLRLVVCKSHQDQIHNNNLVEEILRKQAQHLLLSHDAILIRRFSSGRIVFWNRGAHNLYGWSKKKAMGKLVYNLLETELPEPPRDIKAKLRRHGCWSGELVQTKKDGRKIVVASHWSLRQSLNGGPMEILEVNYNLTDKKHSGQKTRERERLALLGTMAAVFAHEVANPLTGLSASLQFVENEFKRKKFDDPFLRDTIEGAMREIDRLGSLLNEFRSLALPQTLDLELTDLKKVIQEVLAGQKMAYRAAGITVKLDFENGLPAVELDAAKMKQAILNLCKNAVEAMREGGYLTLKAHRAGQMVVLEIADNGIGVPEGVNIFELFKTTKAGGTGLGLPLVQQIVSAHNGTITYTTDAGHGTTFTVRLPAITQMM
ncbi:MAG TPA: ATP-binding protein [Candidatus Udaeobacter sp.]|nr:ATP-binding protein [Candidatus Udaeobacter sp.]